MSGTCLSGGDPDAFGGGAAQGDVAGGSGQREGLIVVAFQEAQFRAGANAAGFEEFEETAVAFIDSTNGVGGAGRGIGEQEQAAMATTGWAFHLAEVAVGTDAFFAEFGEQLGFEVGGDGVLEALGFVVHLPPFHAEEFGEHAFNEVVAEGEFSGDLASGGSEANVAIGLDPNQAIFLETSNCHGYGGGGDFQPVG